VLKVEAAAAAAAAETLALVEEINCQTAKGNLRKT